MDRRILYDQSDIRSYDHLNNARAALVGLGQAMLDLLGSSSTIVAGFAAMPSDPTSLSINLAAGDIYELDDVDATAYGDLTADTGQTVQQGFAAAQTLTLSTSGISSGHSRWALVQAAFSQTDDIPSDDPTGGLLPYLNTDNPSGPPWSGPDNDGMTQNTRRQGLATISVIYGTVATTGSEVPPSPSSGNVPLYLVDLAFGQTTITSDDILIAGPSVGTGVPDNYLQAPFLAGMLNSHHSGGAGQAPKINLATEVQGTLPVANIGAIPFGQCRLSVASSTSLLLSPYQGSLININGTIQLIPSAGITIANTGLAASTLYYVYAYMNTGTMTLELSTTGHSTNSANGVEIKTGDATRTLVGLIYTDGSTPGQFLDSVNQRFCANWFNRRPRTANNGGTGSLGAHVSTTDVIPTFHAQILSWSDGVTASCSGNFTSSNVGGLVDMGVGVDGTSNSLETGINVYISDYNINFSVPGYALGVSEGLHYATVVGSTDTGVSASFTSAQPSITAFI